MDESDCRRLWRRYSDSRESVQRTFPDRGQGPLRPCSNKFRGFVERCQQAALVGFPGASDVESGAMVDGGTNDRQADRDVHALIDAEYFDRDSDGGQEGIVHEISLSDLENDGD